MSKRRQLDKEVFQFGLPEETGYGFAQAVKVGRTIYVSGQVGSDGDHRPAAIGDQMRIAYERIGKVLEHFGATMDNVVDETIYVSDARAAARVVRDVRRQAYGDQPLVASTFIGVQSI